MLDRRNFIGGLVATALTTSVAEAKAKEKHRRNLSMSKHDLIVLTRTLYGEARGEPINGMYAVAASVFNRVTSTNLLFKEDTSISRACLRKYQYSCWLLEYEMRHIDVYSDEFKKLKEIAAHSYIAYKKGVDYSKNATHYFKRHTKTPDWVRDMKRTAIIENHIFFKPKVVVGV